MEQDQLLPDDLLEIIWNNALSDIIHQNLLITGTMALAPISSPRGHASESPVTPLRYNIHEGLNKSGIDERIRQVLNLCHISHRCRSMMESSLGRICISRSKSYP